MMRIRYAVVAIPLLALATLTGPAAACMAAPTVNPDIQAYAWLDFQAMNGNQKARGARDVIAARLSRDELAEAQSLVRQKFAESAGTEDRS